MVRSFEDINKTSMNIFLNFSFTFISVSTITFSVLEDTGWRCTLDDWLTNFLCEKKKKNT